MLYLYELYVLRYLLLENNTSEFEMDLGKNKKISSYIEYIPYIVEHGSLKGVLGDR
ncbi:hypothetical protein MACH08_38440 [Oceanobacillus kimchii]|uniref:Uncharacterized protein n=1 Tax=Oceanobacillus kimchii TaxID=746691 RepID=A0ABQ5TNJ5_9BACI|nr:hypothetical protein MACH08_38440 [Oceanobacillus kimchii]